MAPLAFGRALPASAPATRPQSAADVVIRKSRPHSAPASSPFAGRDRRPLAEPRERLGPEDAEPIDKDWVRGDWAAGWSSNPVKEAFPRFTIPSASRGKGGSPGFRDTYLCIAARNKSHVPGPGAHRVLKDFVEPKTSAAFGKPNWNEKEAKRLTPRHLQHTFDAGANRVAPARDGDETDAKRLIRSRPSSAQFPTVQRNACLTDLRKATHGLPSSFHSPGPGAYSQFSTFGQPSGACTKGYMGSLKADNPAAHPNESKESREWGISAIPARQNSRRLRASASAPALKGTGNQKRNRGQR